MIEWTVEVTDYWMWEARDTLRVWWLLSRLGNALNRLDLWILLGDAGVEDLEKCVRYPAGPS